MNIFDTKEFKNEDSNGVRKILENTFDIKIHKPDLRVYKNNEEIIFSLTILNSDFIPKLKSKYNIRIVTSFHDYVTIILTFYHTVEDLKKYLQKFKEDEKINKLHLNIENKVIKF